MGVTAISELLFKFKDTFISKKFILFCCFGVINTFNHSLFSTIFSKVMQENMAYAVGNFFSISIGYFLSSYYIFKRSPSLKRYIRFGVSYVPSFIIGFLVSFITITTLQLPQFIGTALAAVTGGPITFIIMKVYAFGRK